MINYYQIFFTNLTSMWNSFKLFFWSWLGFKKITCVSHDNIANFWDTAASSYSTNDMTVAHADYEFSKIEKILSKHDCITSIVSLGAANGVRDPIHIMRNFLSQTPEFVFINDISPGMINEAKKFMDEFLATRQACSRVEYSVAPAEKMNMPSFYDRDHTLRILGVYKASFLVKNLDKYRGNRQIIGEKFTISVIVLDDNRNLTTKGSITFMIDDYELHAHALMTYLDAPSFYAFSVVTDKDFVSHFFSPDGLKSFVSEIFPEERFTLHDDNDERFLILELLPVTNQVNCLTTMLNNVFGNIQYHYHKEILEKI